MTSTFCSTVFRRSSSWATRLSTVVLPLPQLPDSPRATRSRPVIVVPDSTGRACRRLRTTPSGSGEGETVTVRAARRDADEICAYVESQTDEQVVHLEKAASELI